MKIALVHDYLNEAGGAERVLRVLADMYPQAPIYTAFAKQGTAQALFSDRRIVESKLAWFLKIGRFYSYFRFLLPFIWKSIDLSDFDLVITSTSGGYIARGFNVSEKTKVIAYCHTPPKWLYGYPTPTGAMGKWWGRVYLTVFGPPLRYFDYVSAQRVDVWMANSREVAKRVRKFYRKEAVVVYPPVTISESFGGLRTRSANQRIRKTGSEEFYLLVTRVTGAKGVLEAARAAVQGRFKLKIVGEVVEERIAETLAGTSDWVELVGRVDERALSDLYTRAKGFIALAQDEDFGMTVVEAMAHGTPVLALNSGGYKETVKEGATGTFVVDVQPGTVIKGVKRMERIKWDREKIKKWASTFNREKFEMSVRGIFGA